MPQRLAAVVAPAVATPAVATPAVATPAVAAPRTTALRGRRLNRELVDVDGRLRAWAQWASAYYAARGFPVHLTHSPLPPPPRSAWPAPVLATDEAVRGLCWRLASAAMAHYLNPQLSMSQRALVYSRLLQHFQSLNGDTTCPASSLSAYRADLDRARWSVRVELLR